MLMFSGKLTQIFELFHSIKRDQSNTYHCNIAKKGTSEDGQELSDTKGEH